MTSTELEWISLVRARMLQGDFDSAETMLVAAIAEHPKSFDLRRILSGVLQNTGRSAAAEYLLGELLQEKPHDFPTAYTLAKILISQGHSRTAAAALRICFEHEAQDPELAIRAIDLLNEADRKIDSAWIAERALTHAPDDARLHAYAGMLKLQLGDFPEARHHYLLALKHNHQACEWHVPQGLASAQHYANASHPDFALFKNLLKSTNLSAKARSTLLFALGKAHDDVGDYQHAAAYFRQANALAHALTLWSRKNWRRMVEARLAAPSISNSARPSEDFIPVFIVGMPRSGTTLLAELLGGFPQVCNRGELPWIAKLAQVPELAESPSRPALERAAATYRLHAKQDDINDAKWFIDKQPLNFRYLDLIRAMFPNAKIICCQRSSRDVALSLWMQPFDEDVQGYANDFSDIRVVMRDHSRLMAHWQRRMADCIRTVCYEVLVAQPQREMKELQAWLGLPSAKADSPPLPSLSSASISTASVWQARQPIFTSSVRRWSFYASDIPELMHFPE